MNTTERTPGGGGEGALGCLRRVPLEVGMLPKAHMSVRYARTRSIPTSINNQPQLMSIAVEAQQIARVTTVSDLTSPAATRQRSNLSTVSSVTLSLSLPSSPSELSEHLDIGFPFSSSRPVLV